MSKEKSPYGNRSIQEVIEAEAGHYYIRVGGDIFSLPSGKMAFTRSKVEALFDDIFAGLKELKKFGDETEKEEALQCLLTLKIYPLRIH